MAGEVAAFVWRAVILVLGGLALAGTSFADIAAFNQAMKAGDYKTAAVEAQSIWLAFDKTSADTAAVAREFGFASYVGGDYAAARDFGVFLKEKGASLPTPDDQPATSAVLLAAADCRLDPRSSRDALMAALEARKRQTGLDNISALAAEALYRGDRNAHAWANLDSSGELAAQLLSRGGKALGLRKHQAALAGAAGAYLSVPAPRNYGRMVDVHNAMVAEFNEADPSIRTALVPLIYQAEAWSDAIWLSFKSYRQQTGTNISQAVKQREMAQPRFPLAFGERGANGQPLCEGELDLGGFTYPTSAEFRGVVGAVIMKFTLDDRGVVTAAESLASVPGDIFAAAIAKASPRFQWKSSPKADRSKCGLAAETLVYRFEFYIL